MINFNIPKSAILNIKFFIGTTSGLLCYDNGNITNLCDTYVYGITKRNDEWYFTSSDKRNGIGEINYLDTNNDNKISQCIKDLNFGLHQIDFIGDHLFVTNTYYDSVAVYKYNHKYPYSFKFYKEIFPSRDLVSDTKSSKKWTKYSKTPGHFNSVYNSKNTLKIMAHNVSTKTGKNSQIFVYDMDFNKIEVIDLYNARNCHNIYESKDSLIFCNSAERCVVDYISNNILFKCDKFTRGLSISNDYILLGGTSYSTKDKLTRSTESSIYIFDNCWNFISEIILNNCEINEIRRIDKIDYGLSNSER